jgi:hypothetical protein
VNGVPTAILIPALILTNIPVTVLTGFLGARKTMLVNRILQEARQEIWAHRQ